MRLTVGKYAEYAAASYSKVETERLGGRAYELGNVRCSHFELSEGGDFANGGMVPEVESRRHHVLSLCGTDELLDVVDWDSGEVDVELFGLGSGRMRVHRGAMRYAKLALSAVPASVWRRMLRGRGRVTFVGHSLGGAAALMLPLLLPGFGCELECCGLMKSGESRECLERVDVGSEPLGRFQVITYGSPRCVRSGSGSLYPEGWSVCRAVLECDPVPDMPFRWGFLPLGGWEHVGEALYLNGGAWTEVSSLWQVWRRVKRAWVLLLGVFGGRLLESVRSMHGMDEYRRRLDYAGEWNRLSE